MRRALQAVALLALVGIAVFLAWNYYDRRWLQDPIAGLVTPATFEVPRGTSLSSVARRLEKEGLMDRPESWVRHANREKLATRLKAGEYRLQPGTSPAMLLEQFVAGDVVLHALTLPEGWTFRQALAAIQSHPQVKSDPGAPRDARCAPRGAVLPGHVPFSARDDGPRAAPPGPCASRERARRRLVSTRGRIATGLAV
jgi:cell division protein YceG involved in septum cleavage